jgi:hypothetical protein
MVSVLEGRLPVAQICMVPARAVPEREHVVIHKLLLEGQPGPPVHARSLTDDPSQVLVDCTAWPSFEM